MSSLKSASWVLVAALLCAVGAGRAWSASAPVFSRETAARLPAILERLPSLPPHEQIDQLDRLLPTDPAAHMLASVIADPGLLESLEPWVAPEQMARIAALSERLQSAARGVAAVKESLERLRSRVAAQNYAEGLKSGASYDGADEVFEPAFVTPLSADPDYQQSVHSITARGGRFLINGNPAEPFSSGQSKTSVGKVTLLHPDNPGHLITIYHGEALEGLERVNEKLTALAPLEAAGAAPKLIERGDAGVTGMGRVYFFVQELLAGARLDELTAETRSAIGRAFDRLAQAGLALQVSGPDRAWFFSHAMIGRTPSRPEAEAYFFGASVGRKNPAELKPHYAMLRALLNAPARAPEAARPFSASREKISETLAPAAPKPQVEAKKTPPEAALRYREMTKLAQVVVRGDETQASAAAIEIRRRLVQSPNEASPEFVAALLPGVSHYLESDDNSHMYRKEFVLSFQILELVARLRPQLIDQQTSRELVSRLYSLAKPEWEIFDRAAEVLRLAIAANPALLSRQNAADGYLAADAGMDAMAKKHGLNGFDIVEGALTSVMFNGAAGMILSLALTAVDHAVAFPSGFLITGAMTAAAVTKAWAVPRFVHPYRKWRKFFLSQLVEKSMNQMPEEALAQVAKLKADLKSYEAKDRYHEPLFRALKSRWPAFKKLASGGF